MVQWVVGSPIGLFSLQPVFHDWCNKGSGMCCPVCGMVQITDHVVAAAGFNSRCLGGSLPYVRRHITVNKMC